MSCETNILKENNELKSEVKKLSNKLERCYNSKVTFEHMLKTQRNFGDKSGLGFNKSKKNMTKGEKKRERKMKKLAQEKLSHFMCYRCHEVGHLHQTCSNLEKLKLKKEEERLKRKCFKCHTWGHYTSICPSKKLVKQQEEPQPKPHVEHEKKKKKTRRGGRGRHLMQIQDTKMMSKNQIEKKIWLTSSASSVKIWDTLPRGVLPSLRRMLKQLMRGKAMKSIT
jgi:hypothetical protein